MELREWATRILSADRIEDKLLDPILLTDNDPRSAIFWKEPTRPRGMEFSPFAKREDKIPRMNELKDADKRAICLHRFCGHELLAVEIMAFALLAFPEAPRSFRMGLANTLKEEQGHVRLYMRHLERFGMGFGDLPLFKHFWAHTPYITSPVHYISMMSLTFEMANLDFAPHYGAIFKRHGDEESFGLMSQIFEDEINHVSFGMGWIKRMKEKDEDAYKLYKNSLGPCLCPDRAKGPNFQKEARRAAHVPENWISELIKN